MSFLSILGKIAGIGAAPFTGGASLIPTLVGTGLDVAGALGKGKSQDRAATAASNADQDRLRLGASVFNRGNPGARAHDSVRGDILSQLQPAQLQGEGRNLSMTGGLSPALLSDSTRKLGSEMSRKALLSEMGQGGAGDPYGQMSPTPVPQAGGLENALNIAGMVGTGMKLLPRPMVKPQPLIDPTGQELYGGG